MTQELKVYIANPMGWSYVNGEGASLMAVYEGAIDSICGKVDSERTGRDRNNQVIENLSGLSTLEAISSVLDGSAFDDYDDEEIPF